MPKQTTGNKQIFHSDILTVDTSALEKLGTHAWDEDNNEYVYLRGTASVIANDWVVYDETYGITRLVADEVGPVAIAPTAIIENNYGWFQIKGIALGNSDTIVADSQLFIDGTAGRVDDLSVSGDLVIGAYSMTAAVSNKATCYITYPHVSNELGGAGSGGVTGPVSSTDNAVVRWNGTGGSTVQNSKLVVPGLTGTVNIHSSNAGSVTISIDQNFRNNATVTITGTSVVNRTLTLNQDLDVEGTAIISSTNPGGAILALNQSLTVNATATISSFGASLIDDASAAAARTTLGVVIGTDVQAFDAQLSDIAGLTPSGSTFIVGDGVNFVSQTAAQAKSSLGVGTSDNPQFNTIELGAAIDTTLSRSSAGNVAIEGNVIYRAGGTDVTVADGGTGTSSFTATAVILAGGTSTSPLTTVSGLGTSGQVLTSNGAALAPTWQTAAGGTSGTTEIHRWIDAADFALPDASFAARAKYGTTWINTVLDFDGTSAEEAYYKFQIPNGASVSTTTIDLVWLGATGYAAATSSTVVWDIAFRPVDDAEAMDASTTPAVATATITDFTTANNDIVISTGTLQQVQGTAIAGDLFQIRIVRQPGNAADNFTGDARLLGAMIRIRS